MSVEELIDRLKQMPPKATVQAFDADSEEYEDITGLVWDMEGQCLFIQTDDHQ